MPRQAYPAMATKLMSERQLARWHERHSAAAHDRSARKHAIWQRLRAQCGDTPELREAYLDLDEIEGEELYATEEQVLLAAGSLCVRNRQHDVWAAIYRVVFGGGLDLPAGEEFVFLEDATARARAGQL